MVGAGIAEIEHLAAGAQLTTSPVASKAVVAAGRRDLRSRDDVGGVPTRHDLGIRDRVDIAEAKLLVDLGVAVDRVAIGTPGAISSDCCRQLFTDSGRRVDDDQAVLGPDDMTW